jgi:hypothetical protein
MNKTNLVFGIDDNLTNDDISKNFKLVKFKKYYQRIIFKTGSEYKNWLSTQVYALNNPIYVHIVGHSIDKTDHNTLYEFFSNERLKIIVYYHSDEDYNDKVQKVINLLAYKGNNGRDELIRRVHGSQCPIKFVDQYDANEGSFIKTIINITSADNY